MATPCLHVWPFVDQIVSATPTLKGFTYGHEAKVQMTGNSFQPEVYRNYHHNNMFCGITMY